MTSGSETACRVEPGQWRESEWQRLEIGGFQRDIPAWIEIARNSGGTVLELGAGAGRVTFPLLEEGFQVTAVEADEHLAKQLALDARAGGHRPEVIGSRIEDLDRIASSPGVVIAPMQFIHYLDPEGLPAVLETLRDAALPPPRVAVSLLRDGLLVNGDRTLDALPQMKDQDGWVFSSRITRMDCSRERLGLVRLRESVGPEGQIAVEEVTEKLWRHSSQRFIHLMASAGYDLAWSNALPAEEGAIPSDLLFFTHQDTEQLR